MPQFVLPLWLTQLMPLVILAVGGFGVMLLDAFAPSKHEAFVEKGAKRSELPLASAVVLALSMFAFLFFAGTLLYARVRLELARERLVRAEEDAIDLGLDDRTEA